MTFNRLVITAAPKNFHIDIPKDAGIDLEHEFNYITKQNELFL